MKISCLRLTSTTRHALTVLSLDFVMRRKKIHGCDDMDNMQKIAFDAITILSHLGKYDSEVLAYSITLLNRYEGVVNG